MELVIWVVKSYIDGFNFGVIFLLVFFLDEDEVDNNIYIGGGLNEIYKNLVWDESKCKGIWCED